MIEVDCYQSEYMLQASALKSTVENLTFIGQDDRFALRVPH
jgi:hypothetical protein